MHRFSLWVFTFLWASVLSATADLSSDVKLASAKLLDALSDKEQKVILLSRDHDLRWQMKYTGGGRTGVQISDLRPDKQELVDDLLKLVLSPYGMKMANAVAKQDTEDGYKRHFITFFGDPRKSDDFAWRITEHHFTVVDVHFNNGELKEFGPILLGANPPNLWLEEEAFYIKAWKGLGGEASGYLTKGAGIASKPMDLSDGVAFKSFPEAARKEIHHAVEQRMNIFSPAMKANLQQLLESAGGLGNMKASFYNAPAVAHCKDGGRWDFKLGSENCIFDFETSRGHIHSSIWIKAK